MTPNNTWGRGYQKIFKAPCDWKKQSNLLILLETDNSGDKIVTYRCKGEIIIIIIIVITLLLLLFVHAHCSPFAASVHTLQSLIYTSSSPSSSPSSHWLVLGCPTLSDVFSHGRKDKTFVHIVGNDWFLWLALKKPGQLASGTEFCGTWGQLFIAQKSESFLRRSEGMGSLPSVFLWS